MRRAFTPPTLSKTPGTVRRFFRWSVALISRRLECLPQPFYFKAGAEQREQTSRENHAAFDDEGDVDAAIKLREVAEDGDAE